MAAYTINSDQLMKTLPRYSGKFDEDLETWIGQANGVLGQINLQNPIANDTHRIRALISRMRGDALKVVANDTQGNHPTSAAPWTLNQMYDLLRQRFKPRLGKFVHMDQLRNVAQMPGEGVHAYSQRYQKIVDKITGIPDDMKTLAFISGLQPAIKETVLSQQDNYDTLAAAVAAALRKEASLAQSYYPVPAAGLIGTAMPPTSPSDPVMSMLMQMSQRMDRMEGRISSGRGRGTRPYNNTKSGQKRTRKDGSVIRDGHCNFCGIPGHFEFECRKKAMGLP